MSKVIVTDDFWAGYQRGYQDGKLLAIKDMAEAMLPCTLKGALIEAFQAEARDELSRIPEASKK